MEFHNLHMQRSLLRRAASNAIRPSTIGGFTLIELMIAVAIIAIIAMVALPAYQGSVRKSKRAEAMTAVSAIQQAQERWRSNHPNYSTSLSDLGVSEPALYGLSISAPSSPGTLATGYIIVAEGRGSQAADDQCKRMSVRLIDGNLAYAGCSTCSTFSYATSNACWSR